MNRASIKIGNFNIYLYSICILIGVISALFLINKELEKEEIDKDKFFDMSFYTIIFGILGARIYYVLFNLNYYFKSTIEIFEIWNGGLAIHGGIIFGLLTVIYYTKKHNMNTIKVLDIIVPSLILAQAVGRWGNFFNKEAYGPITTYLNLKNHFIPEFVINGMKIKGVYYTPTFYYESIWNLTGFAILMLSRKKKDIKLGFQTGLYLTFYSLGRFFIEYLRTDSLMIGNIKVAMLVSIILFITGIVIINKSKQNKNYHIK